MTAQSDWPLLSEVNDQLDVGAFNVAQKIIGSGQIPVTAFRSDILGFFERLPERVEPLLAKARQCFVNFCSSEITSSFDRETLETNPTIFGPLCSRVTPEIRFFSVRVRWLELVEALAAVGCAVSATDRSRRRGAYKGELKAYMNRFKPEALARMGDDDIALRFKDYVEAQTKAGRSALKLPQLRNIANQVSKLRPKDPDPP